MEFLNCANMVMRINSKYKWDINFEWNHHVTITCEVVCTKTLLVLGCKPQKFFFVSFFSTSSSCPFKCVSLHSFSSGVAVWVGASEAHTVTCRRRRTHTFVRSSSTHHLWDHAEKYLPHILAPPHDKLRTTAEKSRSLYEYKIIIILSTLHNPLEFCFLSAAAAAFTAKFSVDLNSAIFSLSSAVELLMRAFFPSRCTITNDS